MTINFALKSMNGDMCSDFLNRKKKMRTNNHAHVEVIKHDRLIIEYPDSLHAGLLSPFIFFD